MGVESSAKDASRIYGSDRVSSAQEKVAWIISAYIMIQNGI